MKSSYNGVAVPSNGAPIDYSGGAFRVPDRPIIPFIEGDGTGRDIWKASRLVFDAAVEKAYGGKRKIAWLEVFAGEKAFNQFKEWLPQDTVDCIRDFRVAIKGPLTTPVGGGIRSLNVTLRQVLDLYACVRPVRYFQGVPSPVRNPERMNVVIFRENTEDVYAGIEWKSGTPEVKKLIDFLNNEMLKDTKKRIREDSGIGIKPMSPTGTKRLVRRAIQHAIDDARGVVTLVHKGNIQKFTEGAFRDWGYELATQEFRPHVVTERESWIIDNKDKNANLTVEQNAAMIEPGLEQATQEFKNAIYGEIKRTLDTIYATHGNGQWKKKILVNDRIADSVFQQILTARRRIPSLRDAQFEWRLPVRRLRGAGGRTRHGSRRQYRRRLRRFRSDARHRPEICRQGCDQPEFGDALRRDDVRFPGVEGSFQTDRRRHRANDSAEARHVRPGAHDARREETQDLGICGGHHRKHAIRRRRRLNMSFLGLGPQQFVIPSPRAFCGARICFFAFSPRRSECARK